ncbi:hypothetical protein SCLCIDRAFT_784303 [Scleroderma citrinum Foug A]|uniref:Uncharacterized protein n=1 Tax=Scleroderma citrinum Foug A TaxID=1036808 RepID=A0A0C2YLP1_9AGAM|nr:hypothetical protein SCLCIDRAFT_784303 [Scleroderma citrinum Foug A]
MQGLLIPQMSNSMPHGDKGCAVPWKTCEVGWGEFGLVIISMFEEISPYLGRSTRCIRLINAWIY